MAAIYELESGFWKVAIRAQGHRFCLQFVDKKSAKAWVKIHERECKKFPVIYSIWRKGHFQKMKDLKINVLDNIVNKRITQTKLPKLRRIQT
jgi:hypothetical protein